MSLPAALLAALAAGAFVDESAENGPIAWPVGPIEARVAFAEPIDAEAAAGVSGRSIPFVRPGGSGEEPIGALKIAGTRLEDGGRTLVLLTDPHPAEATYAPDLPQGLGRPRYDLSGVEARWTAEGQTEPSWQGWLPEVDPSRSEARTSASAEHQRAFRAMAANGQLTLRTLLALPEGSVTLSIVADRPFEAELAYLPMDVAQDGDGYRAVAVAEPFGAPVELLATLPTGPRSGDGPPRFSVSIPGGGGGDLRAVSGAMQILPWAPEPTAEVDEASALPEGLTGGDPDRGRTVFFGEQGKCSACHRAGDRGGEVGPDLSDVGDRLDLGAIYRAIDAPSAAIPPEYLPYAVALIDGRVFVGVVRAEGPEAIRVIDADANATLIRREMLEEIRPGATSIMPVGLVGALGEDDLRDLLAYLASRSAG